jgi:hypothetical protein
MLGSGFGSAIITRSSTPFWLAYTGGSTNGLAAAVPPNPIPSAAAAAATRRHAERPAAEGLLIGVRRDLDDLLGIFSSRTILLCS